MEEKKGEWGHTGACFGRLGALEQAPVCPVHRLGRYAGAFSGTYSVQVPAGVVKGVE